MSMFVKCQIGFKVDVSFYNVICIGSIPHYHADIKRVGS